MAGMVPHAGQPFDHRGHAGQRPQIGAKAVGACTLAQGAVDLRQLRAIQFGLATSSARCAQGCHSSLSPLSVPATGTLAAHPEPASDRR